jgi:virginiamycin B lyase
VITEFPLPAASGPIGIVTGPDGHLWIAERFASKVARVSTAGVVTLEYPVPSAHVPFEIALGADGNLWLASSNGSSVSRLVP